MNVFIFDFKHKLNSAFSFLSFPKKCEYCNNSCYSIPLCKKCQERLQKEISQKRCKRCGKELFFEINLCTKCRKEDSLFFEFESVFPVFTYVLQKKRLLYLWKVANNRFMVYFFAKILANILKEKYKDIPIIPVPPRPNKIKEKGWDQIDDLVSILEKKYKFSVIKLLARKSKNQQKKLSKEDRIIESQNSYEPKKDIKLEKIPKEVIWLDDVITTGSTILSCKKALNQFGIEKVHGVSLFMVP